jgi:hypothetical protein
MDKVRVLRVIEYVGPRDVIEKQLRQSLQDGTHVKHYHGRDIVPSGAPGVPYELRVATIGQFPEVLDRFTGALEDIASADETSTLTGAVAIAKAALSYTPPKNFRIDDVMMPKNGD